MTNSKHNTKQMYDLCKDYMHSYVLVETTDKQYIDGILTGVDEENAYLAVPIEAMPVSSQNNYNHPYPRSNDDSFQNFSYGFGGYGYGGYGPGFGYRPPNRFRRLVLPLAFLAGISLLSWY